ncbi:hypothetical protein C0993_007643 [Termitomyces sp. T159_Od127]|nr:hypothetical protein C0993_007643 [Termitomyces sp. T159_Od127]
MWETKTILRTITTPAPASSSPNQNQNQDQTTPAPITIKSVENAPTPTLATTAGIARGCVAALFTVPADADVNTTTEGGKDVEGGEDVEGDKDLKGGTDVEGSIHATSVPNAALGRVSWVEVVARVEVVLVLVTPELEAVLTNMVLSVDPGGVVVAALFAVPADTEGNAEGSADVDGGADVEGSVHATMVSEITLEPAFETGLTNTVLNVDRGGVVPPLLVAGEAGTWETSVPKPAAICVLPNLELDRLDE